ncbi:class I SAM-dependent methyltransferase, partial [Acidianus sp. RZ1]|uniref:class I SAM-dependent methyltransferase n=1 Tax=Acidianus sp. RZ1 TaxID=1540082 RepID=UPI001492446F|nr:class I SAM-dependent methyltransferase [Acidianus sp. RZ1]
MVEIYGYLEDIWYQFFSPKGEGGGGEEYLLLLHRYNIRSGKVLDLGCGTGRVSNCLARNGFFVVGADLCSQCVKSAKSKNTNAEYVVQDYYTLGVQGKFDVILLILTYTWNDDKDKNVEFFKVMNNLLRDEGIVIFQGAVREFVVPQNPWTTARWVNDYLFITNHDLDVRTGYMKIEGEIYKKFNEDTLKLIHRKVENVYV